MEAVKYTVKNMDGKEVGSIDLDATVFGAAPQKWMVHDMVRWQRARKRAGTHQALTRTMKLGGAKKPFKQKGSGRARAGSSISPLWVGGASIHGPLPRDYDFRLPKRARRQAMAAVLSDKVNQKNLIIVDSIACDSGKTKDMAAALLRLGVGSDNAVMVISKSNTQAHHAGRNLKNLLTIVPDGVNVFDLLRHRFIVISKDDVREIEKRVSGSRGSDSSGSELSEGRVAKKAGSKKSVASKSISAKSSTESPKKKTAKKTE